MGKIKTKLLFPLVAAGVLVSGMTVSANTGIERSYTNEAFTMDRYNRDIYEGELGEIVDFQPITIKTVEKGQHLFELAKEDGDTISIAYWKLTYPEHYDIHAGGLPDGNEWKGFTFGHSICRTTLCQPGWTGYCANCGREIHILFYSTKNTISQLRTLTIGDCLVSNCVDPDCNHMEMGTYISHACDSVSWNRYRFQYIGNGATGGYVPESIHYYNNESVYEGQTVTPQTKLTTNIYYRVGYAFDGWNTERDGSGISFSDEEDFLSIQNKLNLSEKINDSSIKLYAQWKAANSTLIIDPNGGTYDGETTITQRFRSLYTIDSDKLTPPVGATVTYDTQGGNPVAPTHTTLHFTNWSFAAPL